MSASENEATAKRLALRALLARERVHLMPGGFSPLFAKMAERVGFESFFLAGSQLAAFLYGYPDAGVLGLRDVVDHGRHMAAQTRIPILVDLDTGYGNAINAWYAVQECVRSGVAGLQIEDQLAPKKSGTSAGRHCVSREEAVGKYRAAVDARDRIDPSFVLCARCDAIGASGENFETALARCVAYAEEGGVDLIWLNSVQTREQLEIACRRLKAPVLAIWGGEDKPPTVAEYEALGVRVVLYPVLAATAAMQAAWRMLNDFKARGPVAQVEWAQSVNASPYGRADLKELTGLDQLREMERLFLPPEAQRDYEGTWGHGVPLTPGIQR